MMRVMLSLLLCSLCIVSAELYGINVAVGGNNTETVVRTVVVDTTSGAFKFVTNNFIYVGDSGAYDGISAFDNKNEIFYYTPDFDSAFLFAVDVKNASLLPPISIGANYVALILRDDTNEQLLVTGQYQDGSVGIIVVPDTGSAGELVNLTDAGIAMEDIYTAALDESTNTYFMIYNHSNALQLGTFALSTPKKMKSVNFSCGDNWEPIFLSCDTSLSKLVGLAMNVKGTDYAYFEIDLTAGKCTVHDLKLNGIITSYTYDPSEHILYFAYVLANGGNKLEMYNTQTEKLTSITSEDVLADLAVSYST